MCKAFMIFLSEICDLKVDSFGGSLLVGDGSDCQSSLFPLFFFFFIIILPTLNAKSELDVKGTSELLSVQIFRRLSSWL